MKHHLSQTGKGWVAMSIIVVGLVVAIWLSFKTEGQSFPPPTGKVNVVGIEWIIGIWLTLATVIGIRNLMWIRTHHNMANEK